MSADRFTEPWPQPSKLRIHVCEPWITEVEQLAVSECLNEGWVGPVSPWATKFEAQLSAVLGQDVATTSNGSVALMLALRALGVGPGDEVIVPALTYAATASSVMNVGAAPILCDVEPDTWCLDPAHVNTLVTERTRAIIAVHVYGVSADLASLRTLCDHQSLFLIEDAAEAFGGSYLGAKMGTIGDVGTYSFFANKLVSTGEGGAVTSNNPSIMERMRLLRGQGMDPKRRYFFLEAGYNFRMGSLPAALGVAQMDRLAEITSQRAAVEHAYHESLGDLLQPPKVRSGSSRAPWIFTGRLMSSSGVDVRGVAQRLADAGVETRPVFWPLSSMPAFARCTRGTTQQAEAISSTGISLPTSHLIQPDDISRISSIVRRAVRGSHASG
jgi:perosamine synthetase